MSTTLYETDFYAWTQQQASLTYRYAAAEVLKRSFWP